MGQLKKRDLKNLKEGEYIVEKMLDKQNILFVEKVVESDKNKIIHIREIITDKKSKIVVGENFNREGDRKYKSKKGSLIVKYFSYVYTE
jgi:hypothetical protein